ncbi:hypothetical protein PG999_008795 [Apiospora kogelbergensis]|uniref:Cryptic loci regulator 2 N-terminal domain-containing protein n=1 Tax=Apiospora kogelbergensis TaxID=1337665 RepID=A0AAW0QS51_9PEZI
MAAGTGTIEAYPFTLAAGSSDGKAWADGDFNSGHQKLAEDDKRYVAWLFRLGTLLRDQFLPGPEHQDRTYFLDRLPDHYHIRYKTAQNRLDYYLYGYPHGNKPKAFRSPNDFFPHLIWIVGGSKDKSLCSCQLCNPEQAKPSWWPQPAPVPAAPSVSSSAAAPKASSISTGATAPSATPMSRTASASSAVSKTAPAVKQVQQPTNVVAPAQPNIIPGPVAADPPAHSQTPALVSTQTMATPQSDDKAVFREGEAVWFLTNPTWRLGIVLEKLPPETQDGRLRYMIKQLAHSLLRLETHLRSESEMRPFLAFSVPAVNLPELQNSWVRNASWDQLVARYAGDNPSRQELVGVEGSKKVLIEIDHSYSLFNVISDSRASGGKLVVQGIFLGAERINVGEAVRIRLKPQEINPAWPKNMPILMVLKEIYVAKSGETDGLFFNGDVYRLEEISRQQAVVPQTQIPLAMIKEKAFRDSVRAAAGTHFQWVPVLQNVIKDETAIRGRFYETSRLMAILDQNKFDAALTKGEVEDVQAYLNNRADSKGVYVGLRKNRLEMLAGAVPDDFVLSLPATIQETS